LREVRKEVTSNGVVLIFDAQIFMMKAGPCQETDTAEEDPVQYASAAMYLQNFCKLTVKHGHY
jgi:hypothetical protein